MNVESNEFLSPIDLLKNAKSLVLSDQDNYLRPAVLEAISCLESYVQAYVFRELEHKMDPLLLKWLQDRTRNDFDSRLSVIIPIATGLRVDKRSDLWNRYKRAKQIRNRVTHVGKRVTTDEAEFVIDTVESWLTYLASTITLQLQLEILRDNVENGVVFISDRSTALDILQKYLSTLGDFLQFDNVSKGMTDAIFSVGQYKIAVSVVFVTLKSLNALKNVHADSSGLPDEFSHGVSLVFNKGELIPDELSVKTSSDGRVITMIINISKS
ncbi:MAG: hypothetical protein K9M96_08770 [Deltaproteobacteria bacterium]|nr:hypothetical protein [Deltaproteobacteria bacterium]